MKKILLIVLSLSFFSCSSNLVTPSTRLETREPANFQTCLESMTNLMAYRPYYGEAAETFSKAKTFVGLEKLYGSDSLIDIQLNLSAEEIKKNNENIIKLANAPFKVRTKKGKISALNDADTNIIYQAMEGSEVNKNHWCYDTKGTIGFCFGRATIAHMEAIVRNINPESVKKIWIAGNMKQWGHHVATMVNTEKGWMVLDTNIGHPVTVEFWLNYYKPFKAKEAKEVMAFVTQAGRFGPYDTRAYNAIDLFNTESADFKKAEDYFNGYFHDYFESLDNIQNKTLKKDEEAK
ncbi:MAG: hypothetical protein H7177_14230 [Rhizobacter sp.]|nr:hypothetical protein [Bacteriovorax sp.]